jgi:hypothetical protein
MASTRIVIVILFAFTADFFNAAIDHSADFNKIIETIIVECQKLKPGASTRADLLKIFERQGGVSGPQMESFVYRGCPYIHINVEFQSKATDVSTRPPSDIITKISDPYLGLSVID